MNSVQITGNLTKDPIVRATKTGKAVASMTVAVNTRYTVQGQEQEMTAWVPVVAWGNLAEEAREKLKKGSYVFVEGRINTRSWDDDKQQRHWVTEIVARIIAPPFRARKAEGQPAWGRGNSQPEWGGDPSGYYPQDRSGGQPVMGGAAGGMPGPSGGQDRGNFGQFGPARTERGPMEQTQLGFPSGNKDADEEIPF